MKQHVMLMFDDSLEAIWFVSLENSDWLAGVRRNSDGLQLRYRWRYYRDEKAHDSIDKKNEYRANISTDLDTTIARITSLASIMAITRRGQMWQCIRGGQTTEQMAAYWFDLPFNHLHVQCSH
jgi:hypothetical protein